VGVNKKLGATITVLIAAFVLFSLPVSAGRQYNPTIGRFMQPDPKIPDPYNPQSLNRYSYALNNPMKYTDPTGNEPVKAESGSSKVVGKKMNDLLRALKKSKPDATAQDLFTAMKNYYGQGQNGKALYNVQGIPRYVYTGSKGSLDMKHVFGAAELTAQYGSTVGYVGSYGVEVLQTVGGDYGSKIDSNLGGRQWDSAWTIDDLPADDVGIQLASRTKGASAEDAAVVFEKMMGELGATDPEQDPLWSQYKQEEVRTFEDRSFKVPWIFPFKPPSWWR